MKQRLGGFKREGRVSGRRVVALRFPKDSPAGLSFRSGEYPMPAVNALSQGAQLQ